MGTTEAITIIKGLTIRKQTRSTGWKSSNWYSWVYLPKGMGKEYDVRTTGTSDQRLAIKKAQDHWAEVQLALKGNPGQPLSLRNRIDPEFRFDRIAEARLELLKAEAGSDPKLLRHLKDEEHIYFARNGLAKFFGRMNVRDITTQKIRDFLDFHVKNSLKGKLAQSSKKRTLVSLNQHLKHAFERQLIPVLPLMPKVKLKQTPRPWVNKKEYRTLYEKARVFARESQKAGDLDGFNSWMEMADFVVFVVNSFLRPSEWQGLRHRDVKIVVGTSPEDRPHLEIAVINGKTGERFTRTMPRAYEVYERMIARSGNDPDAFLFKAQYTNRQTATERMRDQFDILLKATSLKYDALGVSRTVGSLRHSSLMFRLLEGDGVDHHLLAKNAGTSVGMLERFYLSHAEVSMKIDNLHSFKPKASKRVDSTSIST